MLNELETTEVRLPDAPSPSEEAILENARADWRIAFAHWSEWREQAKEDFAFVAGDQWEDEDKRKLSEEDRPAVVFNRVGPVIDAVVGQEVTNRQEIRYIPRAVGDATVNEALTAAAKYFRDQCNAEDEETDAFFDCVVCGLGITETRIDFDEEPDGRLVIERVDPFEVWVDPAAHQRNLHDARFVFRVKDLTPDEVEAAWPGATTGLLPSAFTWGAGEPTTDTEADGTPVHIRQGRQYEEGKGRDPRRPRRKRYRVVEYQWKEWVPVYRMIDPQSGSEVTFDRRRFQMIQRALRELGAELPRDAYLKQKRLQVKRAFIIGDTVLEYGEAPHPMNFTYSFITGKRDRNAGTWYGIVRPTKDPQRWANKFFSQTLHIINTNSKGGILAEQDAFEDWREAEEQWSRADSIIWLRPGGIARVQPKPPVAVPPDITNMMMFAISSLRDVTGINLELLGMAQQEQAGVLEYQRRQAGITILAALFDSLRRYRKGQGKLMLYFIQHYVPEGVLIKIDTPGGPQYIPLMKDDDVIEYDVIVDEAPSSPNLREQVFAVLQVLIPQMVELGMRIPQDVLDYLPLPESLVQAFRQANTPKENPSGGEDPTLAAAAQYMQLKQQEAELDAQLKIRKQQVDEQVAMRKMEAEVATTKQKLELEREAADREAQVELIKAQIEELRLQTMLAQATEQPQQLQGIVESLAQSVAESQKSLIETQQRLRAEIGDGQQQLDRRIGEGEARQGELASAMQRVLDMMSAEREIVRDRSGRAVGVRMRRSGKEK